MELLDRGRARRDGNRRRLLLCEIEPAECDVQFLKRDLSVERAEVGTGRAHLRFGTDASTELRWRSGNRGGIESREGGLERCRPAHARDLDRQLRQRLERNATRALERRGAPFRSQLLDV